MSITAEQRVLVQQSFARIVPIADEATSLFYERLFQLDPSLRPLFTSDLAEQEQKLIQTLQIAVQGLNNLGILIPVLQHLAVRHVDYGVRNEHYATVGDALLWTLEQELGDEFTADVRAAWLDLYNLIASVMTDAATSVQQSEYRDFEAK